MGKNGTEITKNIADIVLLDDNYASIVTACLWGRNIYKGIRKFIMF
jgi:magnesium-transporting ATPase (P-type)